MNSLPTKSRLLLTAATSALPLLGIVLWAYAPAAPHDYPDLQELLLNVYLSAATPVSAVTMRWRQAGLLLLAVVVLIALLRREHSYTGAVLAGVMASFILTLPAIVPLVLEGKGMYQAAFSLTAVCLCAVTLHRIAFHLPAVAAPLAALLLMLGIVLGVYSSAEVVIRSNPPLFVLANAARNPDLPAANLALGMHLLSIGGAGEAEPILRRAGKDLSVMFRASGEQELLLVSEQIANWRADTQDKD